ncbi:MAG: HpcH/HpaI aldolase family protein [Armatimonadota bacterium]
MSEPMAMRPSRVLRKLRAGRFVSCIKSNLEDARSVEIAAMVGSDCVWAGMEHVANDWRLIEEQIWAGKAHDMDVMVRVARGSYSDYIRPLELDAAGIMVPHCMSAEDARNVVRMTRFHPVGRRPIDGGNADAAFCQVPMDDYIEQANEQRFVILQIEDPEPMEELDEIAAVEGYDMLFFGPGDFSHALGVPGQMDHPKIVEARERIPQVCAEHGKIAATTCAIESVRETAQMGYQFIACGADVISLVQDWSARVESFREQTRDLEPG